jgi:hypothetical protein
MKRSPLGPSSDSYLTVPCGSVLAIASNAATEMEMRIIAPYLGPPRVDASQPASDCPGLRIIAHCHIAGLRPTSHKRVSACDPERANLPRAVSPTARALVPSNPAHIIARTVTARQALGKPA